MKKITNLTLFLILLLTSSCDKTFGGYKYETGSLPSSPVNLSDFNTQYDDYNSTAPSLGELIPFCFSTNRHSAGDQFDIIYEPMNVNFDKETGELIVKSEYANWSSLREDYEVIDNGLAKIKTFENEFGPNLILEENTNEYHFTLMYATDETGNAQINFISNITDSEFSEPKEIDYLNSEFDDLYPTFNDDKSELYFCSNRNGEKFDIFHLDMDAGSDTESILNNNSNTEVLKNSILSSNANDKCPFIFGNKMVFTSDRAGGFGGYDLYYSDFENGSWSEPVNFGANINSVADEFRPILINEEVTEEQTMLVFSSDRTGGLGGFDLYFLGIDNE